MTTDSLRVRLDLSIDRAVKALEALQRPDGLWNAPVEHDPRTTATYLIVMAWLGVLDDTEAAGCVTWLRKLQRPDGAFPPYPDAALSHFGVTVLTWAAFRAAGVPDDDPAVAAMASWVAAHGGSDRIAALLTEESDPTSLYAAMAGLLDPDRLPDPVLWLPLVPGAISFMQQRMNAGTIMVMFQLGWVTWSLRTGQQRAPTKRWAKRAARKAKAYMQIWQNDNGNWDGSVTQTALTVASLVAMGHKTTDPDIAPAIAWMRDHVHAYAGGLRVLEFTTEAWSTAYILQALMVAGVRPNTPPIERGVRALLGCQNLTPVPAVDQPNREVASGGWAFETDNAKMSDTDDTATAVITLLRATREWQGVELPDELARQATVAADKGLAFLLGMQAPSGGFPTFVHGLPDKPPGPMFTQPLAMPKSPLDMLELTFATPPELGDPPLAALTGRILSALGERGYGPDADEVKRAVAFLEAQRCPNGVWWSRWLVNYVAGTAFVLRGLKAVGTDMDQDWIRNAVAWLLQAQNDDGGWGETHTSYLDPEQAGIGPSMAPLTALALCALLELGLGDDPACAKAADYLLAAQRSDGLWNTEGWCQVFFPPYDLYAGTLEAWARPLEALARYRLHRYPKLQVDPTTVLARPAFQLGRRRKAPPTAQTLEAMRQHGDPVADALIARVFEGGDADVLRTLMGQIQRSDDPIPDGMPDYIAAWFDETDQLPDWFDKDKIHTAHQLFTIHGWLVAVALFLAALPQAYACARGALVLTQTMGMTRHTTYRVLETAQFIFDVANPRAFGPKGRGIRAPQKVRLMHAAVRHLILERGRWDTDDWGIPINQEDLLGTLMTFSSVTLDALRKMGVDFTDEQAEAWMHLWSVVGHLMGVCEDFLPITYSDGQAVMTAIRDHLWEPSPGGEQLTRSLLESMQGYLPSALADLPAVLLRNLNGDACADLLGVPEAGPVMEGLGHALAALGRVVPSHPTTVHLGDLMSELVEEALVAVQREGKETRFRIPTELVRDWNLTD